MSKKPKLKLTPLPKGLSKLPTGSVYLGFRLTKISHEYRFYGWKLSDSGVWEWGIFAGDGRCHYAAPRDSAIAREILGVREAPKKAKKAAKKPRVQRSKRIGVMPAAQDAIRLRFEKFGVEFCQIAERDGIDLPDWLPALPQVPAGFSRWEPSTKESTARDADRQFGYIAEFGEWCFDDHKDGTAGFYIEAVRDDAQNNGFDPKGIVGKTKPQLALIPPAAAEEMAKALECGAKKYGPWNWRENKVEMMTYLHAQRRHIDALIEGEDIDPESGANHLGCVMAGAGIILDARKHGTLIDNRPPKREKHPS